LIRFIHANLFLGAAAAALIPVLIHLISRYRYRRERWAAMGFLLAAMKRSTRRIRLETWLLLLLRILVVLMIGMAVARPYVQVGSIIPAGAARVHRVLLIDNSGSMQATVHAASPMTRQERAVELALRLLDAFPEQDTVSLITLANPAEAVIAYEAFDRHQVIERLKRLRSTAGETDLLGGLQRCEELLDASNAAPGNRAVYLISDQRIQAWGDGDAASSTTDWKVGPTSIGSPSAAVAAARRVSALASLHLIRVADQNAPNLSVVSLTTDDSLPGRSRPVRFRAEVVNFGDDSAVGWTLAIRGDDRIVRRIPLDAIAPQQRLTVPFSMVFDTAGTRRVEARIEGIESDALSLDNVGRLSVEVRDSIPVLLVDGRPSATPFGGQCDYLATALAPGRALAGKPPVAPGDEPALLAPKVILGVDLAGEPLPTYGLVVLCNIAQLHPSMWERLTRYVHDGGALAIFMGDAVDREHYNRLAYRDGEGVLPGRLTAVAGDPIARDSFVRLRADSLTHPVVADFAATPRSGLFAARVFAHTTVEVNPLRAKVVLSYDNGAPALVLRSLGSGQVALMTTTANMEWTNLPAMGDYVSLVMNLATYLCSSNDARRNLQLGEPIREHLTAAQIGMTRQVVTPEDKTEPASLDCADDRCSLSFEGTDVPGFYTVSIGTDDRLFAVNMPPSEGDLRAWTPAQARARLGDGISFVTEPDDLVRNIASAPTRELAAGLTYLLLALLVIEMWAAMRFGGTR